MIKKFGDAQGKWKKFRDAKYERDGAESIRCQVEFFGFKKCRSKAYHLHHIIGRNERPELYYDETNLLWLCSDCHDDIHSLGSGRL